MPKLELLKNTFAGGEIAPELYSRVDLSLYSKAAKLLKNFYAHPQGGASNRPGTLYQATAKYENKKIRLIPFKYSTSQNYIIEFGDYYVRFFTNLGTGGQITGSDYMVDNYTKLLMHMEGADNGIVFTDETGKTVTNITVTELDYMEYATDILAQAAYVTNATYDSYTKLLLHCDGTDASTTFTDETGKTMTAVGGAQIDTAQKKFGTASGLFDVTEDCLTTPDHADWYFGTGDFTIDFQVRFNTVPNTSGGKVLCGQYANSNSYWQFSFGDNVGDGTGQYFTIFGYDGVVYTPNLLWNTPSAIIANTWYHIALVRNNNSWYLFIEATQVGVAQTDTGTMPNIAATLSIGGQDRGASIALSIDGWIDEFRVSKGIARWTSNFTPPTIPHYKPLIALSSSSIKSQGTYSLKAIAVATESLNKTLTRTVDPVIDLTGQVQIKFDIYASRTGANIKIGIHDSGGTTTEKTYTVLAANTWETVTWDISAVSDANKNAIDSIIITILNADADNTFYLDNMFSGSPVITDTAVKAIGSSSAYFDGTNYMTLANSTDFNLETADFTIEGFVAIHTLGDTYFCGNGAETAGGWGLLYNNTAHTLAFWANGASRATVSFTPDADTLYHFAVIRASGTIKLAIEGTFGSGSAYATSITSIYTFTIGKDSQVATKLLTGWLDELRISRGVARWIIDFTPPTSDNIPYEIETPYAEADLPLIQFTQSADVMYLTHPTIQPQELIRTDNTDWDIGDYDFVGGPFMLPNTDTTKLIKIDKVTLGATDATLTATGFTFEATHVGSLWQLEHYIEGQVATSAFTSETTGTAIKCGGTWRLITHGTWTGKIKIERSDDGSTGWTMLREFSSADDYNVNTYGSEDMSDNAEPFYVRLNMADYTSGTCNADLTTDAFYQRGIARITAVAVGGATATATIERTMGIAATDTVDWSEGAWSDYRGWPQVVEFSPQDRLIFANTTTQPQTHWDTKIGNYYDFSRSDPLVDDDGITGNLPSREVNGILSIVPLSKLLALTSSGEWGILSSDGVAITPTTTLHVVYGYDGSAGIRPVVTGNRAIYIQALSSVVRDLGYELYSDSFTGAEISILSTHLFFGYTIKEMAYQQNPDRLVWMVKSDGKLLSLTYMREQEVFAWTWHDTNGGTDLFESIASIPNATAGYNEVWVSVKRGTKRYIERFAQRMASTSPEDQIFMDSAITYDSETPTNEITGLDHLDGYTVAILADGNVLAQQVVADGTITLDAYYSVVHVGIPYNSDLETLNVEVNMPDGTLQGRKTKISKVAIRVQNSRGGYIGPDADTLHYISGSPMAGPTVTTYDKTGVLTLCTGEIKENLGAGYEDGGRMFIRQSDPLPITILALLPSVKIAGRTSE